MEKLHPDLGDPELSTRIDLMQKDTPKEPATVAAPTLGVQEAPAPALVDQAPPDLIKIDETDFLRYQLLGTQVSKAQLLVDMYQRELQRAQSELATTVHAASTHLQGLSTKYNVDFRLNQVSEDGYLVPRPAAQRDALLGVRSR